MLPLQPGESPREVNPFKLDILYHKFIRLTKPSHFGSAAGSCPFTGLIFHSESWRHPNPLQPLPGGGYTARLLDA